MNKYKPKKEEKIDKSGQGIMVLQKKELLILEEFYNCLQKCLFEELDGHFN